MLIYMIYSVVRMSSSSSRLFNIIDIVLTLSYLLMLFGVSLSIKTSVDREDRESRMMKNDFNLFEEEEEGN